MDAIFARAGLAPHNPEYLSQYWQALSGSLTSLQMYHDKIVGTEMCSGLNHLTRLRCLELYGTKNAGHAATVHLQLPQLRMFTLSDFRSTTILLDCPRLFILQLVNLNPLHELNGVPGGITNLHLKDLGVGSVPVEQILLEQKHMSWLDLQGCPGKPQWQDLPHSLEDLALRLPLNEGIPQALEQLTRLTRLVLAHVGADLMHLTRPLDAFLDMPSLVSLTLQTPRLQPGNSDWWTPAALRLLGLADRRVLHIQNVPGGKVFKFTY